MILRIIKSKVFLFFCFVCLTSIKLLSQEISIYNRQGIAKAYIAEDEEHSIYLWSGNPVAYLLEYDSGTYLVYGYNGKHLGWFVNGIIYNTLGYIVGTNKEAANVLTTETVKTMKTGKVGKIGRIGASGKPSFLTIWAKSSLETFLRLGEID
jgi:hypothetical protein